MKILRTYYPKFIILIVALQILNLSIYGGEYQEAMVLKNGTTSVMTNQIDCFAEYVTEILLKHTNAFPEHKGDHTKNEQKTIKMPVQLFTHYEPQEEKSEIEIPAEANKYGHYRNNYDYLYFKEINPPPPKFA